VIGQDFDSMRKKRKKSMHWPFGLATFEQMNESALARVQCSRSREIS